MVHGYSGTQSEYLKRDEAINAMADSQHSVHAMSLIHQKLYQSESLSAINMADYIHELVNYFMIVLIPVNPFNSGLKSDPIEAGSDTLCSTRTNIE